MANLKQYGVLACGVMVFLMLSPGTCAVPQETKPIEPMVQLSKAPDGADMVLVPAGRFIMGSQGGRPDWDLLERPQREVRLDAYRIHRCEVTVAQYRRFCKETGRKMPETPPWGWQDDYPVCNVRWTDASAYAQHYGMELPTEAQWEKAARGAVDARLYPRGSQLPRPGAEQYLHVLDRSSGRPAPVGSKPKGASPFGCLDMAGNVWEWCRDYWRQDWYQVMPDRNPYNGDPPAAGPTAKPGLSGWSLTAPHHRSLRGGSSTSPSPPRTSVSARAPGWHRSSRSRMSASAVWRPRSPLIVGKTVWPGCSGRGDSAAGEESVGADGRTSERLGELAE